MEALNSAGPMGWIILALLGLILIVPFLSMFMGSGRSNVSGAAGHVADGVSGAAGAAGHVADGVSGAAGAASDRITQAEVSSGSFWPWFLLGLLGLAGIAFMMFQGNLTGGLGGWNWLLWSLLGLGGLLTVTGFFTTMRRHPLVDEKRGAARGLGIVTLLSGLLLGLASWFVWQPKIADIGDLDAHSTRVAELTSENTRLSGLLKNTGGNAGEIARLNGIIDGKDTKLADLGSRLTARNEKVDWLRGRIKEKNGTIEDLRARLKTGSSDADEIARLEGLNTGLNNDIEVKNAKISALEAEIGKARNKPAPVTPAPVVQKGDTKTAMQLLQEYGKRDPYLNLVNKDYRVVKMKGDELVEGKKGKYYRIVLKSPGGKGYKFATGKYNAIVPGASFQTSLMRVTEDIQNSLEGRRSYQIYTRGKASAGAFTGKMDPANPYNDIKVLERPNGKGKYADLQKLRHYDDKITNDDLPNLRGAYLQDLVGDDSGVGKPVILDGKVSKSKNTAKQSVDLILYVDE